MYKLSCSNNLVYIVLQSLLIGHLWNQEKVASLKFLIYMTFIHTVKPVHEVTSIKRPPVLNGHLLFVVS
jgi:hypothetical protein